MTLAALLPALLVLATAPPVQSSPAGGGEPRHGGGGSPLAERARPGPFVQALPADSPAGGTPAAHTRGDPYEHFNRRMFAAQQRFDRRFFRPAALGYAHVVPSPVRAGIRHFFSNLTEPVVFLNDLLQLKPGRALKTAARFVINTGLGVGGLVDVAKAPGVQLPHRANGFGDTLGVYGVKPGAYLFLPFVGPTDLRDLIGGQADGLVLPLAVGKPFDRLEYQIPHAVLTGLDQRAESDADLHALFDGAVDPYATLRSVYLQDRAGEIAALKGQPAMAPAGELEDPLRDPAAAPEPDDPLIDPATPAPPAPDRAAPARR